MKFQEFLVEAGFEPYSYSGRFMFGAKCVAVTAGRDGGAELTSALYEYAESLGGSKGLPFNLKNILKSMRIDNMGLDYVYYFPNETWDSSLQQEDESDD